MSNIRKFRTIIGFVAVMLIATVVLAGAPVNVWITPDCIGHGQIYETGKAVGTVSDGTISYSDWKFGPSEGSYNFANWGSTLHVEVTFTYAETGEVWTGSWDLINPCAKTDPTEEPTTQPTDDPTEQPTGEPTTQPTEQPTQHVKATATPGAVDAATTFCRFLVPDGVANNAKAVVEFANGRGGWYSPKDRIGVDVKRDDPFKGVDVYTLNPHTVFGRDTLMRVRFTDYGDLWIPFSYVGASDYGLPVYGNHGWDSMHTCVVWSREDMIEKGYAQ